MAKKKTAKTAVSTTKKTGLPRKSSVVVKVAKKRAAKGSVSTKPSIKAASEAKTSSKAPAISKATSSSLTTKSKPILVVLPGSSGSLGKGMRTVFIPALEQYFDIRVREGKWKGWSPAGESNVNTVLEVCPDINFNDDWYILGNSFGNRVLCAMCLDDNRFPSPPKGLIMCGYPMYGPKGTDERVNLLQEVMLSEEQKLLCISGAKDEFLLRKGQSATDAYAAVKKGMSLSGHQVEVKILPTGKHGVLDQAKEVALQEASGTVLGWIREYFNV